MSPQLDAGVVNAMDYDECVDWLIKYEIADKLAEERAKVEACKKKAGQGV